MNRRAIPILLVDLLLLTALVAACFALRIDTLTIRGEESRWATVAMEMGRTGDWIVPRQQGEPFLSRPPMGSWLIALAASVRGECDTIAVRLPTILAVLAMTLMVYGYSRSFLGRIASIAAAAGFATMPEILQMGRLAESDAVFTAFLGSAFLLWHWGHSNGWSETATWTLAYFLVACATLTKGPQAPVYFGLTVALYLMTSGQWRRLFAPPHALGLAVFAVTLGAWLLPYYSQMGWSNTWRILTGDSTDRFGAWTASGFLTHLGLYPLELIGCTAPCSYLLLAYLSPRCRQALKGVSPHTRYLLISLAVSVPTCWITPGGQTRYLMPLYPAVAVLAGVVMDRLHSPAPWVRVAFASLRGLTTFLIASFALVTGYLPHLVDLAELSSWRQSIGFTATLLIATAVAMPLYWRFGPFGSDRRLVGVLALPALMGLAYAGVVVSHLEETSNRAAAPIAALKRLLPPDEPLRSIGPVHHLFAYHFREPIALIPELNAVPPGGWFCYTSWGGARRAIPFPAEEIAVISMDRNDARHPEVVTIIARRKGQDEPAPSSVSLQP